MRSIYRSPEGEVEIHAIYDRQLERLGLPYESRMVETRFGRTHLLMLGPRVAPPLVVLQGGNTTSPTTLGWIKPLMEEAGFVINHEHNHAGQCWWEMRRADDRRVKPPPVENPNDVRRLHNWQQASHHLYLNSEPADEA